MKLMYGFTSVVQWFNVNHNTLCATDWVMYPMSSINSDDAREYGMLNFPWVCTTVETVCIIQNRMSGSTNAEKY